MTSPHQSAPVTASTAASGLPAPHTVLICDDQPELRAAVIQILADSTNFIVAGEAFDGLSCLDRVRAIKPDLLILDVNMPGGGPAMATAARQLNSPMHILVFSGRQDPAITRAMLEAGADQYVLKTGRLKPFYAALDTAHQQLLRPRSGDGSGTELVT